MKLWVKERGLGAGGEDGEFPMGHLEGEVPADDSSAGTTPIPGVEIPMGCH